MPSNWPPLPYGQGHQSLSVFWLDFQSYQAKNFLLFQNIHYLGLTLEKLMQIYQRFSPLLSWLFLVTDFGWHSMTCFLMVLCIMFCIMVCIMYYGLVKFWGAYKSTSSYINGFKIQVGWLIPSVLHLSDTTIEILICKSKIDSWFLLELCFLQV